MEDHGYYQPSVCRKRYPRALGVLRICYPDIGFVGDKSKVVYNYVIGVLGSGVMGAKLRTIPIAWILNCGTFRLSRIRLKNQTKK